MNWESIVEEQEVTDIHSPETCAWLCKAWPIACEPRDLIRSVSVEIDCACACTLCCTGERRLDTATDRVHAHTSESDTTFSLLLTISPFQNWLGIHWGTQRILWKIEGRATQLLQEQPHNSLQVLHENDLRSLLRTVCWWARRKVRLKDIGVRSLPHMRERERGGRSVSKTLRCARSLNFPRICLISRQQSLEVYSVVLIGTRLFSWVRKRRVMVAATGERISVLWHSDQSTDP